MCGVSVHGKEEGREQLTMAILFLFLFLQRREAKLCVVVQNGKCKIEIPAPPENAHILCVLTVICRALTVICRVLTVKCRLHHLAGSFFWLAI